jgi:uncharacterized protein
LLQELRIFIVVMMKGTDLNNRRNSTWIVMGIGALFLAVVLFSQLARNPSQYQNRLAKEREQKDLQFKNDPDSPIPRPERAAFEGLNYFPADESYRVEATFLPHPQPDTLRLMGSKGGDTPDRMANVGQLQFTLQGKTHTLTAFDYVDQEVDSYFVPFYDLTTAVSTYGGGRYLDVPKQQPLMVDFNRAYHPYCVYNERFLCPLPPRQNKLSLEIRVGERMPTQSSTP